MSLIVQKYGGTSVGNAERIKAVAENIARFKKDGHQLIVTVSAPAGVTDKLTALAKEITPKASGREMDVLLSTGEQISIACLSMALESMGIPAVSLTGQQVGIMTDNVHTKARIKKIDLSRLKKELEEDKVIIVAGFQGMTVDREITTLGRGGSDTTAVAVAAAINADLCEIYTDVDGVYTADPRIVPNPSKLKQISYDEMLELACLGAKVLHPRSVDVAKINKVKLSVRSSFETEKEGTFVVDNDQLEKEIVVTGLASDKNIAKVSIFGVPDEPGIAARIFTALGEKSISVDMIIQSGASNNSNDISFTVPKADLEDTLEVMNNLKEIIHFEELNYDDNMAKISVVGAGMVTSPGVAAKMFSTLYQEEINLDMISTSEIKISCMIENTGDNVARAIRALHDAFELDKLND